MIKNYLQKLNYYRINNNKISYLDMYAQIRDDIGRANPQII